MIQSNFTIDELAIKISKIIIPVIEKSLTPPKQTEIMTRKEVSELLQKDYSTLFRWNKEKILTAHYIGSAVYYKRSEINRLLLGKDEINFNGFDLLSTPISNCLSSRVSNILEPNVSTVNELIKKEEAELIKYRCMGKISLEEIKGFLKSKGLKLGMSNDEVFKFIETH